MPFGEDPASRFPQIGMLRLAPSQVGGQRSLRLTVST
jgi:hypothetical protein